jgi:formylglycine-generating enzyme required for sulfatase activity
MSKPSYYNAVKRFVNILDNSGLRKRLQLSDEDIADTLWLALQMGVENTQTREKQPQTQKEPLLPENTKTPSSETVKPPINLYTPPSDLLPQKPHNEDKIEGLPFPTPAAPALTNKLQISRALRPLMRKVPSYSRRILDVEATVNQIVDALIVEQEIWLPITKPQPERWLNLELVVEENRSSFIWQETINELTQILENYGIFHTVRTWNLSSEHQENLQLVSRQKGKHKNQRQYSYRELYHSNGRGLILLISDCVSTIWQQETIYEWLHKWSNQSPTTIMQLFPERLWLSSELGLGYKVKLSAFNPGVPNSKLICGEDLDVEQALNLPIITLEAESLKQWAKVVAGYGRIQTPAIVLDLEFVKEQVKNRVTPESSEASAEAIVDRFLATASPRAQRLAGLMAAVPVSLPVVHLIQKTMLPKSTPVNVAEVFLSGMIERKKNRQVHEYEFVEGVRKLLNQAMRLAETEKVLDVVSEYIADKMGLSFKSFTALLLKLPDLSQEKKENLLPFAHVAAEVLRNLGGKYADFAEEIETNHFQKILDIDKKLIFQIFAGEYICAVKWGGETGIWQKESEPEHLLISQQGEVQFRSRLGLAAIQNVKVEGQTLSWTFDNNQTAASITFQVNSENSYFWESQQTGKLFQGWLNYPNEGKIDFRGRFNLQIFEFEVALIKVNQPAQISRDNLREIADEMILTKTGKHLNDTEQLVIQGTLANQTYEQIAVSAEYSMRHLKNVAIKLWGVLSEVFGEKVTKKNLKAYLEQLVASRHLTIHRHRQTSQYFIEDLGNGVQLEMVAIPEGNFIMGSPADEPERRENESPQHEVTIAPFYMGKYPVTQAQWQAVAALPQINRELKVEPSYFKGKNLPVEGVSWYDTQEFCDRLSRKTGKPYRLPSEAEWEYACRAGTTTPFHFGETITSELANYDANYTYGSGVKGTYREKTTEVGSFGVANAFGLYDMHGLVWEWCADHWHENYDGATTNGSAWIDSGSDNDNRLRLLRGGSWCDNPANCRCAIRYTFYPDFNHYYIGFRVVCVGVVARTLPRP